MSAGVGPLGLPSDDELPDELILLCRPCDVSNLPKIEGLDLTDIVTIEHIRIGCDECARPVWIGPRQQATWQAHPDRARRLCYWCAFAYLRANGQDLNQDIPLIELGGGKAPKRGV